MRSKRFLFALLLPLAVCQTPSVAYRPASGVFEAAPGERAVLFTFLVREVSVSRSQGAAWYVQATEEDANSLYAEFAAELTRAGFSVA